MRVDVGGTVFSTTSTDKIVALENRVFKHLFVPPSAAALIPPSPAVFVLQEIFADQSDSPPLADACARYSSCCAGNRLPMLHRLQLLLPLVQKPPMYTPFLRQRHDVIAAVQARHCHSAKFLGIPPHSSLCHSRFLSLQSVPKTSVSF